MRELGRVLQIEAVRQSFYRKLAVGGGAAVADNEVEERHEQQETQAVEQEFAPFAFPLDGLAGGSHLPFHGRRAFGHWFRGALAAAQEAVFAGLTPVRV